MFSIKTVVSFAASADFPARFRTSSATTANPFPDSPALAASTAAFSARILVWNAISSMVLMMLLICCAVPLISFMERLNAFISSLLSFKASSVMRDKSFAFSAFSALLFICSETVLTLAVSSSRELACSAEP